MEMICADHVLQMCLSLQDSDVYYIPTSGLSGENLTTRSKVADLTAWYTGPCLLEQIGGCVCLWTHLCSSICMHIHNVYSIIYYNIMHNITKLQYNVIGALLFLIF